MTIAGEGVSGGVSTSSAAKAEPADAALQRAVQKAALRFVPLLTIAYLFNYLDRTSLGFAALTMNKQLGLSDRPVRSRRRYPLRRLFAVRSAEQSVALPGRNSWCQRSRGERC
jgi:hypothetical protein